jgi:hypothetical protein
LTSPKISDGVFAVPACGMKTELPMPSTNPVPKIQDMKSEKASCLMANGTENAYL